MHGRNSVPVCNKRRTLLWRSKFGAVPPQERSTSQQSYLRELPPSLLTNAKRKKKRRRNRLVYNGESCTRNCTAKRRPVRYVGRYISSGRAINETGLVASVNAEEGGGEELFRPPRPGPANVEVTPVRSTERSAERSRWDQFPPNGVAGRRTDPHNQREEAASIATGGRRSWGPLLRCARRLRQGGPANTRSSHSGRNWEYGSVRAAAHRRCDQRMIIAVGAEAACVYGRSPPNVGNKHPQTSYNCGRRGGNFVPGANHASMQKIRVRALVDLRETKVVIVPTSGAAATN